MTNEEKFVKGTVLYKDDAHGYVLELWEASTNHCDSIFYFSDFNKSEWVDDENQVFQWLLECASKLNFPFHAYSLAKFAMGVYNYGVESALCVS